MKNFMRMTALTENVLKVQVETEFVECATEVLSNAYNPVEIKPISGAAFHLKADATIVDGLGITLASTRSGIQYDFENPYDGYGLTVPLCGKISLESRDCRCVETDERAGIIVDSSKVTQAIFSGDGIWRRIAISTSEMHSSLRELTGFKVRERIVFDKSIDKNSSALKLLMALSDALHVGFQGEAPLVHSRVALTSLKDTMITVLLESLQHNYSSFLNGQVAAPAPRQVRHAEEFIHANARKPIQLKDIASAAGVSPRSLQMSFKKFRHMSPMAYLRKVRLKGVHAELLSCPPGTRIASIAYSWGFAHMGMFAASFHEMFNETPSATLRRNSSR